MCLDLRGRVWFFSRGILRLCSIMFNSLFSCDVVGDWARARNWHNCYVKTGLKNRTKNRHVMCCEPGGVRFFVVFPREFVTEIKLMRYCGILLWNLEASRQETAWNTWENTRTEINVGWLFWIPSTLLQLEWRSTLNEVIFLIKYFGARTYRACFVNTNCMALNLTLPLRTLSLELPESRVAVIYIQNYSNAKPFQNN